MTPDEIRSLTLLEVRDAIASGALTSVEVTEAALEQAERFDASHNLFTTYAPELARSMAAAADTALASGAPLGPLHGVPVTIKDNVDVAELPGSAATLVLKDRIPTEDATVVARLKAAGAVILGKVNMHEMAMGGTSSNAHHGPVRNPWDPTLIPGGSSGASAACVSLRIGYASLGTDAAGSVRIPSMCCGIVGLKQTHGLVPLTGGLPTTTQHVDHIGPHTRTIADARAMLEVMAGYDDADVHSSPSVADPASPLLNLKGVTVGLPEAYFWEHLDPEIESACRGVVEMMVEAGATVVPVDLDPTPYMIPLRSAMSAEMFVFHEPLITRHPELYSPDLRYRILAGQYVLAHDYVRGMRARRLLIEEVRETMASVDVLAMPTLPIPPFAIEGAPTGPEGSLQLVRNTSPFNMTGHPAVTIPAGTTTSGAPIGFQLTGQAFGDYRLLAIAELVESLVGFDPTPPVLMETMAAAS
jgi:aspartyl-tRNA(Asn)/glutamyl-tRNA(Gln) amidotransferase subunit A